MCGECHFEVRPTRRRFLAASIGSVAAIVGAGSRGAPAAASVATEPVIVAPDLSIHPRTAWAGRRKPRGPLKPEPDVKFLLVHHTAGSYAYGRDQVAGVIRSVCQYQQAAKGWPDTCYNFFIDKYGGVWEGREGSIFSPVMADATGGSQGFAQLVCLLGNFEKDVPTKAMIESLTRVLGWLAVKYDIDLDQANKVSFTSRGSNKWRKGVRVAARPISGHRDMSYTACPGRNVYPLLARTVPRAARAYKATIPLPG